MVGVGVENVIQIVLLLKLGIPPFHSWVVRVLDCAHPFTQWILFTTQKFIPLNIIREISLRFFLFQLILVRTILLLLFSYVYSITRILFLSSARNIIGAIIILMGRSLWIIYLLVYVIRISVFIIFLSRTISFRFSSLALTRPNKIFLFSLLLFNLGGIPPMVGFLLKLISLKFFIEFGGIVVFVFLLISLLILRIYISISYWAWGASQPFLDVHLVNKSNWVIEVIAVFMLVLPLVIYLYI